MREKLPVTWSALTRIYRRMELRGEIRGGRFVAGFSGEQFALPEAVELLRHLRRQGPREAINVVVGRSAEFPGNPDAGEAHLAGFAAASAGWVIRGNKKDRGD